MSFVSNKMICYWCNRPGSDEYVKNGIVFCWQSNLCPFEYCGEILEKMDTMVDDYECPVCMETKKSLEMPRCSHKVCLDCYKTIMFGVSKSEKPCIYDLKMPDWTFEQQFGEDGEWIENEMENEHNLKFLSEKMNYEYEDDKRSYEELITIRDSLMCDRPGWMNKSAVIHYENELFILCSEWRIKEDTYLSTLTIGNQRCPLCRA